MAPVAAENRLRRFLLLLASLSLVATLIELWLEDHTQEALQLLPFVLCGAGLVAALAALLRPSRATLLVMRVVMVVLALGGLVGMGVHLLRNYEFAREIRPNAAAGEALVSALKGASPLFAPAALIFAALLALAATYYHPAFGDRGK
jgi:hypothetical protein